MKIAFLGNTNNVPFIVARACRELGHDVTFLVDSNSRLDRPEYKYAWVTLPYPSWIRDVGVLCVSVRPSVLAEWWAVLKVLRAADLVVLNGFGIRFGGFLKGRVIVILTGSDIELYSNRKFAYRSVPRLPVWKKWAGKAYHHLSISLMRAGIRNCAYAWTAGRGLLPTTDELLDELGVSDKQRIVGWIADVGENGYRPPASTGVKVRIFSATRFVWHEPLPHGMTDAENKRNDILIRGLALLFERYEGLEVEVVFVRKGVELEYTYELLHALKIADRITWLDELTQREFYEQILKADIVAEQFGRHLIGLAGCEAMQLGRPVVANGRLDEIEKAYGIHPPIVEAKSPEEVCEKMAFLIFNPRERLDIGRRSREFALAYLAPVARAQEMLQRVDAPVPANTDRKVATEGSHSVPYRDRCD